MGVIQIFSKIQGIKRIRQCGLIVIGLSLFISGCSAPWEKAGATVEMFNHDNYACDKYAIEHEPPEIREQYIPAEKCKNLWDSSRKIACVRSASRIDEIDINEGSRNRLYRHCMREGGWSQQGLPSILQD